MKKPFDIKLKRVSFHQLFGNNRFLVVFSLLLSVALWFSVSMTLSNPVTKTITSVPVTIDLKNTYAEKLNLKLFGESTFTVDAEIEGENYQVHKVKPEDIVITAQTNTIEAAGKTRLWLNYKPADGTGGFAIKSISPAYIDAYFDVEATDYFSLTPQIIPTDVAEDGYIQDAEILSIKQLKVTGPKLEVDKISRVYAMVQLNASLTQTATFDCQIKILDSSGHEPKYLDYSDNEKVEMTIPVLKEKELPFKVSFKNQPTGYLSIPLGVTVYPEKITIAGPESAIDEMSAIDLGDIDFSELSIEKNIFKFPIHLLTGMKTIDDVEEVTVKVNMSGMKSALLSLPTENILFKNVPAAYNASISSNLIERVTVIGPGAAIEKLDSSDIIAEIDLSKILPVPGEHDAEINVYVKNNDRCWAYGEYKIKIKLSSAADE